MRLRVLLATLVATFGVAGTASAHELPGGFNLNITGNWFEIDNQKLDDLQVAARSSSQSASTSRSARCVGGMAAESRVRT